MCRCGWRSVRRTSKRGRSWSRGETLARSHRCRSKASAQTAVGLLDEIQQALYARALKFREDHTQRVSSYDEFKRAMEGRPGFVIAAWCGSDAVRGGDQGGDSGDGAEHSVRIRTRRSELRQVRTGRLPSRRGSRRRTEQRRGVRPARPDPFHERRTRRHPLALDDGRESLGQLVPPSLLSSGPGYCGGDGFQARLVADRVQCGDERRCGERRSAAAIVSLQVIQRDGAAAQRQRLVKRAADRAPVLGARACPGVSLSRSDRIDQFLKQPQRR